MAWVPGSRSKFGNWTSVPSLYSWNIAECDVKPQSTQLKWPYAVTSFTDQTWLHQLVIFVTLLPNLTSLPNLTLYPIARGFHMFYILNGCEMPTEDVYSSGHLVLSHFGTPMCSNVDTIFPKLVLFQDFWVSDIPRYLYFTLFFFCIFFIIYQSSIIFVWLRITDKDSEPETCKVHVNSIRILNGASTLAEVFFFNYWISTIFLTHYEVIVFYILVIHNNGQNLTVQFFFIFLLWSP